MFRKHGKKSVLSRILSFAGTWLVLSFIFPLERISNLLVIAGISLLVAYFAGKAAGRAESANNRQAASRQTEQNNPAAGTKRASERTGNPPTAGQYTSARQQETAGQNASAVKEEKEKKETQTASTAPDPQTEILKNRAGRKKSYGPEIDPLVEEGNRALSEMGRLYMSIEEPEIRTKINEIMRITDKITQDAIDDPADIPQIKKFFRYYLPTTIKLLHSYDRMASQGIEGENIDKSMKNISEMLDVAIAAYKKRLDSLFEDQALDIETDIDVMNQMLEREGLTGEREFNPDRGRKTEPTDRTEMTGKTENQYGAAVRTAAAMEKKG